MLSLIQTCDICDRNLHNEALKLNLSLTGGMAGNILHLQVSEVSYYYGKFLQLTGYFTEILQNLVDGKLCVNFTLVLCFTLNKS